MSDEPDTTTWLLQAARTVACCALAYLLARLLGLREGYWSLITAVVVTQPLFAATLVAGRDRILGTLAGALMGFAVLEAVRRGAPVLPLFWIALLPLALLTAAWPNLRLSCVTLIIVVLVPNAGAAIERPFDRVVEILLGTLASIVVSALMALIERKFGVAGPGSTG